LVVQNQCFCNRHRPIKIKSKEIKIVYALLHPLVVLCAKSVNIWLRDVASENEQDGTYILFSAFLESICEA
jgi:hypothetical protein